MPRLSEDRVKEALLHTEAAVRSAALRYFVNARSRDQTVMPVVIEALDRYGRTGTFQSANPIADLAQSDPTVRWAIRELNFRADDEETTYYLDHIAQLLCQADPQFVLPYRNDILAAPGFDEEYHDWLVRRLGYLSWDAETLWRELETICEEGKTAAYLDDMRWDDAKDVVDVLAGQGDRHADRVMALLARKIDYDKDDPAALLQPLAARLAGQLRFEPAVPLLVTRLHEDSEILGEECQTALIRIGTDAVVQAVRADYPTAGSHFRLFASEVLGGTHTDLAVETCIGLLAHEPNLDLQTWMAHSLVDHFSTEGNETVRQLVLEDPDLTELRDHLVTTCTLMGHDLPELGEWRAQAEEEKREWQRARESLLGRPGPLGDPGSYSGAPLGPLPPVGPQVPLHRTEPKVGRNDPCPCGSGNKFKKCCLNRTTPT